MEQALPIFGKKTLLRDWQNEDLLLFTHWMQPGHRWQEFDGPYYPHPDKQELAAILQMLEMRIDAGNWESPRTRLAVADRSSNDLLGQVSWYWQSIETNWLSVGVSIYNPSFWGQGIGYESLGLWSDYLFTNMPAIPRLDLRTWSGNLGMMRLAEKLGYRLEARFRRARQVNGRYYDGLGYGILRGEWAARYPQGFAAALDDPRRDTK